VFAFLRKAARDSPHLCVEPLGVLNDLVGTFDPQSMLGEAPESVASMHGFFSSLCTPDMAAAAALSEDLPEAKLVPASLSGVTSLAVARGNLAAVLAAVNTLLAHTGPEPKVDVKLPIPKPLVTLAKVAKGASTATNLLPDASTLASTHAIELPGGACACVACGCVGAPRGRPSWSPLPSSRPPLLRDAAPVFPHPVVSGATLQ
jgi:hypothetical protein